MRANTEVVRGTLVQFTASFYDANGSVIEPTAAELAVVYQSANGIATYTANLSSSGASFVGTFDTTLVANASPVYWSIKGEGAPSAVTEGSFQVVANPATLALP